MDCGPVFISHADNMAGVEMLVGELKSRFGIDVDLITYIGTVLGSHTGPGAIAFYFWIRYNNGAVSPREANGADSLRAVSIGKTQLDEFLVRLEIEGFLVAHINTSIDACNFICALGKTSGTGSGGKQQYRSRNQKSR